MPITGYHYTDDDYPDGAPLIGTLRQDLQNLAPEHWPAERSIRAAHPDGERIRASAVYAWRDLAWAEEIWADVGKRFLYEVEIEENDLMHIGELGHYKDVAADIDAFRYPDVPLQRYWLGISWLPHHGGPHVEILARRVRIVRKILAITSGKIGE